MVNRYLTNDRDFDTLKLENKNVKNKIIHFAVEQKFPGKMATASWRPNIFIFIF